MIVWTLPLGPDGSRFMERSNLVTGAGGGEQGKLSPSMWCHDREVMAPQATGV